jgi:hypothetical protein
MNRITRVRLILSSAIAVLFSLALATPALARGTEGTYGKVNDKVTTNVGFLLIIFFTVLVTVLSIAQWLLERRKRGQ